MVVVVKMYGVELAGGKGKNVVVSIVVVVVDESKYGTRFDVGIVDVIGTVKVGIGVELVDVIGTVKVGIGVELVDVIGTVKVGKGVELVVVEMRCGMRLVVVSVDVVGGRNVELEGY